MPTRRQFIKVGLAGAAVLAAARLFDRSLAAPTASFRVLDAESAATVAALVPVVLAGALPAQPAARARSVRETVEAFDRAVAGLAPAVQKEIGQLFSLLAFAPARLIFTGLWSPLHASSAGDIKALLGRWRASAFDLQRQSYQALTQLIQAAWYDNPAAWAAIGYPGPPPLSLPVGEGSGRG